MDIGYYFSVIAPQALALLLAYWLYQAIRESFFGKQPSAPAAIGRALGLLVFGQLAGFYLVWYFISYRVSPFLIHPSTFESGTLHGVIAAVFAIGAGFLAKRTFENTQSMNLKIVAIVGFLVQGLITAFDFMDASTTTYALWFYIPLVFLGGYLFGRFTNEPKYTASE